MAKISLSISDINSIVTKLNKSSDEIEKIWDKVKTQHLEKIKESWAGKDCDAYISKVLEMDSEIKKAIQSQRLLATTYSNAAKQIEGTQADIAGQINNA